MVRPAQSSPTNPTITAITKRKYPYGVQLGYQDDPGPGGGLLNRGREGKPVKLGDASCVRGPFFDLFVFEKMVVFNFEFSI